MGNDFGCAMVTHIHKVLMQPKRPDIPVLILFIKCTYKFIRFVYRIFCIMLFCFGVMHSLFCHFKFHSLVFSQFVFSSAQLLCVCVCVLLPLLSLCSLFHSMFICAIFCTSVEKCAYKSLVLCCLM